MNSAVGFAGFAPEALEFLRDIRFHNSKTWYESHKPEYRRLLLEPFQKLVADLSGAMLEIDPELITVPAVDKTISRIYRDTRFSKDKSLYRDSIWLTFKRPSPDWKEAPVYFFEVTPESYRYGMGFYTASKPFMDRFRALLEAKPEVFLAAIRPLQSRSVFVVEGERYKKIPKYNVPEEAREWLEYKSFYLVSNHRTDERLFQPDLVNCLTKGFRQLAPLYRYLWEIKYLVDAEGKNGKR
jgi:uncharacterized protein (TIGR02453 family)